MKKRNFMSLQALFILTEIDRCGSQKKAAENLGLSFDTLRKYISSLENEVGYELLISNGRGSTLTIRAQNLINRAKILEETFNKIYEEDSSDMQLKGDVLVSMPLSVSTNLLPESIGEFFEQYPDINLITRSYMDNSDFSTLDADIGMSFIPPNNTDVAIVYSKKVECGYFASPTYLAKHGYPKNFDDMLENHWMITRVQIQTFLQEWKNIIKKAKHVRYVTNSTYAATEIVRHGGGIAIMPMRFNHEGFVCLDNFICEKSPTVYLIANKKSKDIPRVRAVINFYKNLLENM